METTHIVYDLLDQVERLTEQLSRLVDCAEKMAEKLDPPSNQYFSRFLESLPSNNYNSLRRRMVPASMAAKILGLTPAQLTTLTNCGRLKAKGGRYDLMSLLMWLDSVVNPSFESPTIIDDAA